MSHMSVFIATNVFLSTVLATTIPIFLKIDSAGKRLLSCTFIVILVIICFGVLFFADDSIQESDQEKVLFGECIYFSTVTMTTLGYGDRTPTTATGKALAGIEAVLGYVLFSALAASFFALTTSTEHPALNSRGR